MTPATAAGRSLDAQFGAGQFGRVRDLAVAIEAEARAAALEEAIAAVEAMLPWHHPSGAWLKRSAVLEALRGKP